MSQQLGTHVQNRYGGATSSFLIGLTNPQNSAATTIDSTVLGYAVNDVYAAFTIYGGVIYDDSATTNADHYLEHIATGVRAVIAKLKVYTGQMAGASEEWDACEKALVAMSKVGARNRFLVQTDSGTTASEENPNGGTVRPPFDNQMFTPFVPTQTPLAPDGNGETYNDD